MAGAGVYHYFFLPFIQQPLIGHPLCTKLGSLTLLPVSLENRSSTTTLPPTSIFRYWQLGPSSPDFNSGSYCPELLERKGKGEKRKNGVLRGLCSSKPSVNCLSARPSRDLTLEHPSLYHGILASR